jgi:hypothetical protein
LAGCAVDFIGQHKIGEDWTLLHRELLVLLVVNQRSYDVGRQQVWCELNPAEVASHRFAEASDGQRFRQTRDTFQKDVPIGKQANQQSVHHACLAHNGSAHFGTDQMDKLTFFCNPGVDGLDVGCPSAPFCRDGSRGSVGNFRFVQWFHSTRRYSTIHAPWFCGSQNCVNIPWETFA